MPSYSKIIQQAYLITKQNPLLWLFGLFVIGGFNVSFLRFENLPVHQSDARSKAQELFIFFQNHPGFLAALCLSVLIFSVLSLVITNWSRIMLVLLTENILKKQNRSLEECGRKSRGCVWPIIKISLLTTTLMLFVVAGLLLPPLLWLRDPQGQSVLLAAAVTLFLPLAFTISCINIFTGFFIILFNKRLPVAFNLATDFVLSRWPQILGLVLLLMIIYSASFSVGLAVIYLVKFILNLFLIQLSTVNIVSSLAIIKILKVVFVLLMWILLAGLNVLFNTSLLLLFLQLVDPIKNPEYAPKEAVVSPATS